MSTRIPAPPARENYKQENNMSAIFSTIAGALTQDALGSLQSKTGLDGDQIKMVTAAAIPLLTKAMAKNAESEDGANALTSALDKDHDGSVLDDLAGFFMQDKESAGEAILNHVLGSKLNRTVSGLTKMTGIGKEKVMQIIFSLAPVVLGALGKLKKEDGLDAAGLANLLTGEKETIKEKDSDSASFFEKLIDTDKDDDDDLKDEVVSLGTSLLKKFF
jgi:hypothetical protein